MQKEVQTWTDNKLVYVDIIYYTYTYIQTHTLSRYSHRFLYKEGNQKGKQLKNKYVDGRKSESLHIVVCNLSRKVR